MCPARWAAASWRSRAARRPRPPARRPGRSRRSHRIPAHWPRGPQPAARGAAIRIDFGGLPDVEAAVHKLRIEGASLEPKEIFDLFALLDRAADAKSVLTAAAERFPRLGRRAHNHRRFPRAAERPGRQDPARWQRGRSCQRRRWPRLRRDIERQKKAIQESLERFLQSAPRRGRAAGGIRHHPQ